MKTSVPISLCNKIIKISKKAINLDDYKEIREIRCLLLQDLQKIKKFEKKRNDQALEFWRRKKNTHFTELMQEINKVNKRIEW